MQILKLNTVIIILLSFYINQKCYPQKIILPLIEESQINRSFYEDSTWRIIDDYKLKLSFDRIHLLRQYNSFWSKGYYFSDNTIRTLLIQVEWFDSMTGFGLKYFLVNYDLNWKFIDVVEIGKESDRFRTDIQLNKFNIKSTNLEIIKPWKIIDDGKNYSFSGKGIISEKRIFINSKGKFHSKFMQEFRKNKIILGRDKGWTIIK